MAKRLSWRCGRLDILRGSAATNAIVVPSVRDTRGARSAGANGLLIAVAQPYEIDGYRIRSNVSGGIAIGPQDGQSVDDLLMAADLALYSVKAGSRGTYKFFESR